MVLKSKAKKIVWACKVYYHDLHSEQSIIWYGSKR